MKLCTLENVKLLMGIGSTEEDAKIDLLIKQVSASICAYIGFNPQIREYTELQAVNNTQLLQLNHYPIRNVKSVKYNDTEITDYKILPQYARNGQLYRGTGWSGGYYTRGMTYDCVSGEFAYEISYTAGWYLPGDANYIEGEDNSLPFEISVACMEAVTEAYNIASEHAQGIKSRTEGGISTTFGDTFGDSKGILSIRVMGLLDPYKVIGVA